MQTTLNRNFCRQQTKWCDVSQPEQVNEPNVKSHNLILFYIYREYAYFQDNKNETVISSTLWHS
jgi:hypothetical protein